jgi:hypothetical protein
VRLLGAALGGDLSCTGATFRAERDAAGNLQDAFSGDRLKAAGGAFLRGVDATGQVRLAGAALGGTLDCTGATFRAERGAKEDQARALSLDGANVGRAFFLRGGAAVEGTLDLIGAEFGHINDAASCWPAAGDLLLNRCRYGAFTGGPVNAQGRLDWLARQDPSKWGADFWPQPYEQCARVLREMGHGDDARKVLIEKERRQRAARRTRAKPPLRWLLRLRDELLGVTVGYGRQPIRAFGWLLGLWLLGAGLFWGAYRDGAMVPASAAAVASKGWAGCLRAGSTVPGGVPGCFLATPDGRYYPRFQPLAYSAETLLPVVDLDQRAHWTPDPGASRWRWLRGYLRAHTLAGWALGLLAIAGFSGLVKSD